MTQKIPLMMVFTQANFKSDLMVMILLLDCGLIPGVSNTFHRKFLIRLNKTRPWHTQNKYLCQKKGIRCVRVIHGKGFGSVNKEPILKKRVRGWLIQKQEIIAYVEAPRHDGGSGAIIVLIEDN